MSSLRTPTKNIKIATSVGFIAILLWSTLALFTAYTGGNIADNSIDVPPFQLLFFTFLIGTLANFSFLAMKGQLNKAAFTAPKKAWLLGVGGLFFYHFFYFKALSNAPEIEAGLIAYLWPLLIVLFSALLPGEQLRWYHMLGSFVAFMGAIALILFKGGSGVSFESQYLIGYLFALVCAVVWSLYSVFNRQFTHVPSTATVGFCFVVAILGLAAHYFSSEVWVNPVPRQWLGIIGLGIGPVGLAFFVWDYGTKHGDIQLLGTLSYFAPLLSTLLLIIFTEAVFTIGVALGCSGIIFGALIAVLPRKNVTESFARKR